MGASNSKTDLESVELIKSDIINLITRLKKEEGQLDSFIKKSLHHALDIYDVKIKKEKNKRRLSNVETKKMDDLIAEASYQLSKFSSIENKQPETSNTSEMNLHQIKNQLFGIEKTIKTKTLSNTEADNLLRKASSYYFSLSCLELKPEEEDRISSFIFKLYLQSSCINNSAIIERSLIDLNNINKNMRAFKVQNLNSSSAKNIKEKLKEFVSSLKILNKISEAALEELDNFLEATQTTSEDVPISSSSSFDKKKLNMTDSNLPKKNRDESKKRRTRSVGGTKVKEPKKVLRNSSVPIHTQKIKNSDKQQNKKDNQKKIIKHPKNLKSIEEKIAVILESTDNFTDKRKALESLKQEINKLNTSDNKINVILNRVTGCIIMESTNYLRQLKKTIDTYKIHAEKFPFAYDTDFYREKFKEIESQNERTNHLPKDNLYIKQRIDVIHKQINEVLNTLKKNAEHNQLVISDVKKLENEEVLVTNIQTKKTSNISKLNMLNEIRKKMYSVDNIHKRIVFKKVEICTKIQEVEETIYETLSFKVLKDTKSTLNKIEANVWNFKDVYDSAMYKTTEKEISDLRSKVHNDEDITMQKFKQVLNDTIETVLEVLKKASKENSEKNKVKKQLKNIQNNNKSFEEQKNLLDSIIIESNNYYELSTLKNNIQSKINIQEAKQNYSVYVQKCDDLRNKITSSLPFNRESFENFLNKLFSIKDSVDDMPKGDKELDEAKQQFSTEIYNTLSILDEQLGRFAKKQKQSENIVDLQNQFNKKIDKLEVQQNSLEFVRIIRAKAKSFEERAKYYLGFNDSVDYYVIHENLMRFVEELDRVVCDADDDLLKETVETINYIKDLLSVLSSNASTEL